MRGYRRCAGVWLFAWVTRQQHRDDWLRSSSLIGARVGLCGAKRPGDRNDNCNAESEYSEARGARI